MQKTAIIIPCYNEANRLDFQKIILFLEREYIDVFFANDGSTDTTASNITAFISLYPDRCFLFDFDKNEGKANTIYKSVQNIQKLKKYEAIAYFDADFSTPASEMILLIDELYLAKAKFVIASRILLLNSGIKRKVFRHYIGRFIISFINIKHQLGIYDTQCGAKVFSTAVLPVAFEKPFYTSWLFDVEIFTRLRKKHLLSEGKEIPISHWRDVEGSKLNWASSFKILKELFLIYTKY